jgi:hypothetical protein
MPSERGQLVDNESHRKRLETISQVSFNVVYMYKAKYRINGGSDQTQVRPLMFCRRRKFSGDCPLFCTVQSRETLTNHAPGEAKLLLRRDRATVCIDSKHYTTVNKMRSLCSSP